MTYKDPERNFYLASSRPSFFEEPKQQFAGKSHDILVIPDVHSYERDKPAFDLLMNTVFAAIAEQYNITKVVQLGDLLECGEYSTYGKSHIDETVITMEHEIEWAVNDFWNPLKSLFNNAELMFVEGNHEARWHSHLIKHINNERLAQYLSNVVDPCNIFEKHNIKCARYGNENPADSLLMVTDKIVAVHGWSHAKHAAHTHLDKVSGAYSVLFGHTHRMQSFVRSNPITNDIVGAWSFGAIAKTGMYYQKAQPSDHCLGFGIVSVRDDDFSVYPIKIIQDDKKRTVFLPDGSYYKG